MSVHNTTVVVNEIFYSLQGESSRTGFPSLFIRLAGCNLNCRWCDTAYAKDGNPVTIASLLEIVHNYPSLHHITITGGEPLLQHNTITLLEVLSKYAFLLHLETNGSISIKDVPLQVRKIVDVKTPSSGQSRSFNFQNLTFMQPHDEIKFVIADDSDYIYSIEFMKQYCAQMSCVINFSPAEGFMKPHVLAEYILRDRINVRFNMQLHKIVWHHEPKHY